MLTNRRKTKYDKDKVYEAVLKRMTEKGKGFFIISCGAWSHPENTVPNCYAIMFDGFIQYKFELTVDGFRVAEIRQSDYLNMNVNVGDVLTQDQFITKIQEAR